MMPGGLPATMKLHAFHFITVQFVTFLFYTFSANTDSRCSKFSYKIRYNTHKDKCYAISIAWRLTAFITCCVVICIFTARRIYASAVLGVVILSVCLSVRLSVCLSHACFVTNSKNLPVTFLYHMKGQPF